MKQQFMAMLAARGLSSLIQAANLVLMARFTTLADFGLLAVLTSVSVLVLTIFDFGMSTLIPKCHALNLHEQVSSGLRLNSITTYVLALTVTITFSLAYTRQIVPLWAVILVCALALEKKVETGLSVFIADGNKVVPNVSILIRRAVPFSATAIMICLHKDPMFMYATAYLAVVLLSCVNLDFLLRGHIRIRKSSRYSLRRVVEDSWPYYLGNLSAHARFLDTTLVAAITSMSGAAIYSSATKIVNPLQLVPQALTAILMPHSARLGAGDARRLVNKLTIVFLSMLLLLVPTAFFAEPIVVALFGSAFAEAAPVLAVSLMALPFVTLSSPLGGVLQGQGLEKFVAVNGVATSAFMLVSLLICAVLWGPLGAAMAVGLSFTLKCALLFLRSRRLA